MYTYKACWYALFKNQHLNVCELHWLIIGVIKVQTHFLMKYTYTCQILANDWKIRTQLTINIQISDIGALAFWPERGVFLQETLWFHYLWQTGQISTLPHKNKSLSILIKVQLLVQFGKIRLFGYLGIM